MTRIGTYQHPQVNGGKALPLYSCDGFINTLAGNNMMAFKRSEYKATEAIWRSLDDEGKAELERQINEELDELRVQAIADFKNLLEKDLSWA